MRCLSAGFEQMFGAIFVGRGGDWRGGAVEGVGGYLRRAEKQRLFRCSGLCLGLILCPQGCARCLIELRAGPMGSL